MRIAGVDAVFVNRTGLRADIIGDGDTEVGSWLHFVQINRRCKSSRWSGKMEFGRTEIPDPPSLGN